MTCPHANISLPTTSDPDTVCADCGEIIQGQSIMKHAAQVAEELRRRHDIAQEIAQT